ncbi:MAG: 2-oxoacid:acceptor oxidoreductase subunit alpha [Candidatus Omnitrophica bacterium]|nr:2-oxoacid:acceptor oxidoreductase subunit alpha [Candidatus Omnitrophota bacterium]
MMDISILITGQAGQGIQTVEKMLAGMLGAAGYNVFATKEYMSRVRGGANSTQIRISGERVRACTGRIDILLVLDEGSVNRISVRIKKDTLVIGEFSEGTAGKNERVGLTALAKEIGNPVFANVIASGIILSLLGIKREMPEEYLKKAFGRKGEEIVGQNIKALEKGYENGERILKSNSVPVVRPSGKQDKELFINGTEAVGLGAIAGGCNFVASYPMSPSTGVLTFLAGKQKEHGIIVEQAEDEISAVNMVLGAWYAGARGMVTTSGGGFALMEEGVSLAGMTETPIVIHLGQRPAPATGLPTRMEQADLNLALYAGHGEFPRIIFAPGKIEDAFSLTQKAFNLADKYQIPVFILTDQYFLDSYYNLPDFTGLKTENGKYITETGNVYKRYKFTETGISPRGIPGYGGGLVRVDSDEHDEDGFITEDMGIRKKMVEKRWKKLPLIEKEVLTPEYHGEADFENLVIGWGSTYHVIKEALDTMGDKKTGFLHFRQVYPLGSEIKKYLGRVKKAAVIENNYSGQFADLIKLETGYEAGKIGKYDGLPFYVEDVAEKLTRFFRGG